MPVTVANPLCPACNVRAPIDAEGKCTHCGSKKAINLNCRVGRKFQRMDLVAHPKEVIHFSAHDAGTNIN